MSNLLVTIKRLNPVDAERKLNVNCPGRLLNVLCTFNLRPVTTGKYIQKKWKKLTNDPLILERA